MSEVILDAVDYDKILEFALPNPFSRDYYKRVLSLLKTNFTVNLAAYTCWSKEGRLILSYSIGFSDDFMRQAHSIYMNDEFSRLFAEQYSSNSWNGIFYSQDADPFTFVNSKTIVHLHENHMHYFAIMVLSKMPRMNIVLCKTDKEGPFSQREKEILQRICNLLTHQEQIRKANMINEQLLEIINSHCTKKKTGVIIVDEERSVLSYNQAALSLLPRKLNPKHIDDIVSYVFSLLENEESSEPDRDESEQTVVKNGRCYSIEEFKLTDDEGRQTEYSLITIRRDEHTVRRVDLAVSAAYGLTEREANVAELLLSGYSNSDIADQLHISIHTVKIHVSSLFRKLNVHSRLEAIMKLT